jgi:hypothetical protein
MNLSNLANLAKLSGGAQSYAKCSNSQISQTMHEFADKKLKDRANKVIKNKSQAIAIALSQAESKCKYNQEEKSQLISKVNEDLNSDKQLNLTNIIETKKAIEILHGKNKYKQIYVFKKLLFDKIIKLHLSGDSLSKNMWEEINQIHKFG